MSYEIVKEQERLLQFDRFNNDIAFEIGALLLEETSKTAKTITVDISRSGHQVFHAAMEGTSPDIDEWVKRKRNTVYRTFASTLGLQFRLQELGLSLEKAFHLDPNEFIDSGGGFPIVVKGVGFIGVIVVSGTSDLEEHELITSCLSQYLKVECPRLPQ